MEEGTVVGDFYVTEDYYGSNPPVGLVPDEHDAVLMFTPQNVTSLETRFLELNMDMMDVIILVCTIIEKLVIVILFYHVRVKRKTIQVLTSKIRGLERDVARSEYVINVMEEQNGSCL